jgi:hypothetical protein
VHAAQNDQPRAGLQGRESMDAKGVVVHKEKLKP